MTQSAWRYPFAIVVDLLVTCGLNEATSRLSRNNLTYVWVLAGLRWIATWLILSMVGLKGNVLQRFMATMCFLSPFIETGALVLLGHTPENRNYSMSYPGRTIVASLATAIACLFWEVNFPESGSDVEVGRNKAKEKQQARALFIRVIRYSVPDALYLVGGFLFLALAVLCEMCIPYYTGKVIDILGADYQPNDFQSAILCMGLFSLSSSLSSGMRGGLFMCTISRLNTRIRLLLFKALVKQEIGFFESIKTGDLTSRLSTDTKLMNQSVPMNVNILLRGVIKTVGVLTLMVGLSWRLTLVTFIEAPLIATTEKIYNTHYQKLSKEVQDLMALANDTAGESVAAIRTVRSFNTERSEHRRYDNHLMDIHNLKARRDTIRAGYLLVRRVLSLVIQFLMLNYGRQLITEGRITTGNLVSFILYQGDLGSYVMTVVYMYSSMLNSVGAAGKVFEYLDREPQVSTKGTFAPDNLNGHVQFQDLTFFYRSRPDKAALKNLTVELKPGHVTALVGPSGGGKSTCVSLLERFYQPQSGEILLDGKPLHSYEHHFLHQKVAMVGQEPVLFSGSIRDNICYGLSDCSLEDIQEAACTANAHGFISQLEKGYDTDVGEGGGQLSSGEKQRIAIARALVRKPQVLILDEVTSSLDTESEHVVQQALASCRNQTLLVIAHRLKTIEKADKIVVIDKGTVQEQGTHDELMNRKGNYFKLIEITRRNANVYDILDVTQ